MKRFLPKVCVPVTGALFLLLTLVVFIAAETLAEGSRDLYPSGMTTGRRAYLMSRPLTTTPATFNPFPSAGTHRYMLKPVKYYTLDSVCREKDILMSQVA